MSERAMELLLIVLINAADNETEANIFEGTFVTVFLLNDTNIPSTKQPPCLRSMQNSSIQQNTAEIVH